MLLGTAGDDTIIALGGDDNAIGGDGDDVLRGDDGNDFLSGQGGRDMVFGGEGNDDLLGGAGNDMLYGEAGSDRIFGDGGNDLIDAGAGNDTVYGGAGDDLIIASQGDGDDTYYGDEMAGGANGVDTLDMAAITADVAVDLGTGFLGRGSASSSQTGIDTLWDIENVITGSGNDTITASNAVNVMDGGAGNDTFRFLSAAAANGDTIHGFQPGDKIDLSAHRCQCRNSGQDTVSRWSRDRLHRCGAAAGHAMRRGKTVTTRSCRATSTGADTDDFKLNIKGHHNLTTPNFNL